MYMLQALILNFETQRQFVKYLEKTNRCTKECWLCPAEPYPNVGISVNYLLGYGQRRGCPLYSCICFAWLCRIHETGGVGRNGKYSDTLGDKYIEEQFFLRE